MIGPNLIADSKNQEKEISPAIEMNDNVYRFLNHERFAGKSSATLCTTSTNEEEDSLMESLSSRSNSPSENSDVNLFDLLERDQRMYRRMIISLALEDRFGGNSKKQQQSPTRSKRKIEGHCCRSLRGHPRSSNVLNKGFRWRDFPELLSVLDTNMKEYFASTEKSIFSERLLNEVREAASEHGYTFGVTENVVRDRIRNYFQSAIRFSRKRYDNLRRKGDVEMIVQLLPEIREMMYTEAEVRAQQEQQNHE